MTLEAKKTKLVEFGRFAQKWASKRGRKRPETIWDLLCTALTTGKATFGLDCVQKSHDCDVQIRCGGWGTRRFRSRENTSIKCFAVTMRTMALPETYVHCGRCIVLGSIIGAKC